MQVLGAIIGLGNIGQEYDSTRHNMGFFIIDSFLQELLRKSSIYRISNISVKKISGQIWSIKYENYITYICKPTTYMNLSGVCVKALLSYYSLLPSSLLVIHDELDIALGQYKIKYGGGEAGHKGLKSISQNIGTQEYSRLRIGIGRPHHHNYLITNWVLGKFTKTELSSISSILPSIFDILYSFIEGNYKKASS